MKGIQINDRTSTQKQRPIMEKILFGRRFETSYADCLPATARVKKKVPATKKIAPIKAKDKELHGAMPAMYAITMASSRSSIARDPEFIDGTWPSFCMRTPAAMRRAPVSVMFAKRPFTTFVSSTQLTPASAASRSSTFWTLTSVNAATTAESRVKDKTAIRSGRFRAAMTSAVMRKTFRNVGLRSGKVLFGIGYGKGA